MYASTSCHAHNKLAATHPLTGPNGFTAIELLVVVAIIAVLAALAGPSFTLLIERWRVRDAAESLTSSLYLARSEAIKRGGGVTIDVTGGWNTGWKLTYTQNGVSTDIRVNAAPSRVSISHSNGKTALYVDRWGMLTESSGGVAVAMNFLLYPEGKSQTDSAAVRLCVGMGGRIVQVPRGGTCPA